jgi:murein DD-endopeptidase MepM/ murein hydrolase activator NlpD
MEPAPRRGWRKSISTAVGVATVCIGGGIASASGGGGGVAVGDPPDLDDVICLEKCAGERDATVGSTVRLDGRRLDDVQTVRFKGDGGRIAVDPRTASRTAVEAKVPQGAVSGTVRVEAFGAGAETPSDKRLRIVGEDQIPEVGEFKLTSAEAMPRKTYYDGVKRPQVSYLFAGAAATDIRVEVISRRSHEVVSSWIEKGAKPNTRNTATWDGRDDSGGLAANGGYKFRIGSVVSGKAETTQDSLFGFYRYRFPVAAKHGYGDGYGAGRGHQGQDVFAKCGSPLYAARGGRVQWNKTHSAAGHYLVIDLKGSKVDHMYAHLVRPSSLRKGARVRTGQRIGSVGDSGNASGCHLHFEIWSAPGWYEGGDALPSVTKSLKAWDSWS